MSREMEEPPFMLDGARVHEFARFDDAIRASGHASAVVGGVAVDFDSISGLVIVEELVKGQFFLLHCNDHWETVASGTYAGVDQARLASEAAYPGVKRLWTRYRELTPEEAAEVETTGRFLREIAAGDL